MERARKATFAKTSLRKIIALAAVNDSFRKRLIQERDRSVAESGLRLSKIEEQTLVSMSDRALEDLIKAVSG